MPTLDFLYNIITLRKISISQETIAFSLDVEKRKVLDEIAAESKRDRASVPLGNRSEVLNEAIDAYLEIYSWQIDHIKAGLRQADTGEFASEEEVAAAFAKWHQ